MTELPGVAALADRPVDGRRVALVMAFAGIAMSLACLLLTEHLLRTANDEATASAVLAGMRARDTTEHTELGHAAIVLVDGMRVDEARRMRSLRALPVHTELSLPLPTLSRPFYHMLFTGVPPDGSGVRTNRFDVRARHDTVLDRVRARGGSVFIVADGLPWMRIMAGRPRDGGSDAPGSIDGPLDRWIERWREAPAPSLLIVHPVAGDRTAHEEGVFAPAHRAELARAERVIARIAAVSEAALFVLSDHGHLDAGGHGGPEREVSRSPFVVRAPGLTRLSSPVDPTRLAASVSAALGVDPPRSAVGAPLVRSEGPREHALRGVVRQGRRADQARLEGRRSWAFLVVVLALAMALGPIKRAYGFDRSVLAAFIAWPVLVVALHLALRRPLSLSAIDGITSHSVRVAAIGAAAAIVAFLIARALASKSEERTRRAAASVGWIAIACALGCSAWIGFALGPWPLDALAMYLPLLTLGAASSAIVTMSIVLFASAVRRR